MYQCQIYLGISFGVKGKFNRSERGHHCHGVLNFGPNSEQISTGFANNTLRAKNWNFFQNISWFFGKVDAGTRTGVLRYNLLENKIILTLCSHLGWISYSKKVERKTNYALRPTCMPYKCLCALLESFMKATPLASKCVISFRHFFKQNFFAVEKSGIMPSLS